MGKTYVLDTSVWINLLSTEAAGHILSLLAGGFIVPPQVAREIVRDPISERLYNGANHPFKRDLPVISILLEDRELDIFLELVSGRSVTKLGDGEAAAIAVAAERDAILAIDEGKARRVVRELFPTISMTSSAELLRSEDVVRGLGRVEAELCFEKALRIGGMHLVG